MPRTEVNVVGASVSSCTIASVVGPGTIPTAGCAAAGPAIARVRPTVAEASKVRDMEGSGAR